MPKLIAFLACEKVVIDKETDQISLISIFSGANIPMPPDGSRIPEKTAAPFAWAAVTMWNGDRDDALQYEQLVTFLTPDGDIMSSANVNFSKIPVGTQYRVVNRFKILPISQTGACILRLQLREASKQEWKNIADFPIIVKHVAANEATKP